MSDEIVPDDVLKPPRRFDWVRAIVWSVVSFFILIFFAPPALFQAVFLMVAGWALFLRRVIPQVTVDWPQVWVTLGALVVFVAGLHQFLIWLRRSGGSDQTNPWRFRSTAVVATLVVFMFIAGTAMVGIVHQAVWLARSDEPWVTYGGARRRTGSHFNIRGIAQGVQVYESVRRSLPAGMTRDETGWPLHGWMTMILPYVEEGALYNRVRFGEPWDSPDNAEIFATQILQFENPGLSQQKRVAGPAIADYAANELVMGPGPPMQAKDVTDGMSKTIFAGEVMKAPRPWGHPQNWRDPRRGIDAESPHAFGGPWTGGLTLFAFGDTHVQLIAHDIDPKVLEAMATPRGGEKFEFPN
jgi:hypothetical protein